MADAARTKTIALVAAGAVVALLVGAAAGWFARESKIGDLEAEITRLEDAVRDAESRIPTETADATGDAEVTETSGTEEPPATTDGEEAPVGEDGTTTGVTERQPGLIVEVTGSPGANVMRIDYVLFLTGGEAADAAAAHGDESPPPNDYYVVNDNPLIRDLPIQSGIPVTVVTNDDGTSDPDGHTITLAQWVAALAGPHANAFKSAIYWVTITDGTVTAIEAQYVP